MALTPFDMEGVNRDLPAAGNPAKPDMQSILRRNARDLVLGNAILVSSVDAKELEFGVHMAYSDADGGFDTDPSEDVWFEASSLPIPNERPDLPPDNALRIRVTDVLTEYGFTDIDVKAPDRTPEGIWSGFEAMQPVRLDVTSAQEGRSVSFTLTAAEANDWRSGRLDAHGLSRMAVERVLARPGDTVTLAYGDSLFRPAVMCDGSGRLPEHRVKAGIGTFVIGRESEAVMPEILRIDRTVDPRDPLVIEKAFGKENDMENGNVPEYWKGLMDEADLPLAGIVREHGGGLMDFHRMKGIERLTGSSDWDFYSWTVENYDDDLLDVCERENAADVLAEEGLQPRRNHVIIMDEMHRALRASPLMVEKLDLLTRLNRQWGVGQIMITHTFKDLMCMETPAQNTKARGFVERSEIKVLGALSRIEVDRYLRGECGLPVSRREEDMLEDWATPVNFGSDASHKGLGRFLIKLGGLPGIPINVEMCPLEKSGFNDTNLKWHA